MLDIGVMIIIKVTLFEALRVSLYNCSLICHYIAEGKKGEKVTDSYSFVVFTVLF